MIPERIEREILIEAPVDVVWRVVTEPEHISGWFSDSVELDLRPGGEAVLRWNEHGTVRGRVERVEPPRFFSVRWAVHPDLGSGEAISTLVEFSLTPEGDSTRLAVVEIGFRDLGVPDDEKQRHADAHRSGWELELGELEDYLRERAAP